MSDQNDDSQRYALIVLAGLVVLAIAAVLARLGAALASRSGAGVPAGGSRRMI